MSRRRSLPIALFALAFLIALGARTAWARPGGGGSFHGSSSHGSGGSTHGTGGYSGGSHGSSSSSGGGPGTLLLFVVLVAVILVFRVAAARRHADWSTISPGPPPLEPPQRPARQKLEALRAVDPNFSIVVFEDFVYALYTELHSARGRGQVATLTAYFGPSTVQALAAGDLAEVRTIVIGAMRFLSASEPTSANDAVRTTIELESNYTEVNRAGREQAFYVRERWSLVRRAGVLSRTPQKARLIACPNCGAPLGRVIEGRCGHCNTDVCTGGFDWIVEQIETVSREPRGPMLTEETREEGTNLPTISDPGAAEALEALAAGDAAFAWPTIETRVARVFEEFQRAWSARDLASMRPLMSETLFQTQTYWIETYRKQGLRNVTERARIQRLELARVSRDAFFDGVTVRLFATSLDYTLADRDGSVVVGSRTRERAYSEYWTFIRGRAQSGGATSGEGKQCPNCGAPLTINMAGACTYCKASVSSGEFDWVLSRIEQDEVYGG